MSPAARWLILLLLPLAIGVTPPVSSQATPGHAPAPSGTGICAPADLPVSDPALEAVLHDVLDRQGGQYGAVVIHLDSGTGAALNPDRRFDPASLFKLGVMVEVLRQWDTGRLGWNDVLPITSTAAAWDLGTLRTWAGVGQQVTVGRLLEQMITISDNTAAIVLADRVGWPRLDAGLRDLGLCSTQISRSPFHTTARDMATLVAAIARGEAVSAEASARMEGLLLRQQLRDRIPAGVPREVPVGNKTGNLPDATHDVAIVYAPTGTYVLAVLSDRAWASAPIVELSRRIYAYYEPPASARTDPDLAGEATDLDAELLESR